MIDLDDVDIVAAALDCNIVQARPNGGGSIMIHAPDLHAFTTMPIHVDGTRVWWCYQEYNLNDPKSIDEIRRESRSCLHRVINGDCETPNNKATGCIHVRKSQINP
jgi:hypothetical protein